MIDSTLEKRGQLHLIYNQPLRLVEMGKNKASSSVNGVSYTQKVSPMLLSSSRPKAPDPQVLHRVGYGNVPHSSTSARGGSTAPQKRPSNAPSSTKKRQKAGNQPGCPICGGPHHLVKDCPVTAEGSKR